MNYFYTMVNEVNEPAVQYNYISAAEYLAAERQATEKHEYYKGQVFAMSGASYRHNQVTSNLSRIILPFLNIRYIHTLMLL